MVASRRGCETRTAISGHPTSKSIRLANERTVLALLQGKLSFGFAVHSDRLVSGHRNRMYFVVIECFSCSIRLLQSYYETYFCCACSTCSYVPVDSNGEKP